MRDKCSAHGLDRIYRKDRRLADFKTVEMGPVLQVLGVIPRLRFDRAFTGFIHGRIHRVENATHQYWPPDQFGIMSLRDLFDLTESQVGPGTRAVVKELQFFAHLFPRASRFGPSLAVCAWPDCGAAVGLAGQT